MSNAANYLEEQIGTHLLRTGVWPKPAGIFVALFTTMPAEDGSGGVEVSGGNYARVQHGPADDKWAAPTGGDGQFANIGAITFPAPNADWGSVVGFGLFDAATGGIYQTGNTLAAARNIVAGDPAPNFPAGALKMTIA